jgi:hypothetical protein
MNARTMVLVFGQGTADGSEAQRNRETSGAIIIPGSSDQVHCLVLIPSASRNVPI